MEFTILGATNKNRRYIYNAQEYTGSYFFFLFYLHLVSISFKGICINYQRIGINHYITISKAISQYIVNVQYNQGGLILYFSQSGGTYRLFQPIILKVQRH